MRTALSAGSPTPPPSPASTVSGGPERAPTPCTLRKSGRPTTSRSGESSTRCRSSSRPGGLPPAAAGDTRRTRIGHPDQRDARDAEADQRDPRLPVLEAHHAAPQGASPARWRSGAHPGVRSAGARGAATDGGSGWSGPPPGASPSRSGRSSAGCGGTGSGTPERSRAGVGRGRKTREQPLGGSVRPLRDPRGGASEVHPPADPARCAVLAQGFTDRASSSAAGATACTP